VVEVGNGTHQDVEIFPIKVAEKPLVGPRIVHDNDVARGRLVTADERTVLWQALVSTIISS
jgi:hypothetical protein